MPLFLQNQATQPTSAENEALQSLPRTESGPDLASGSTDDSNSRQSSSSDDSNNLETNDSETNSPETNNSETNGSGENGLETNGLETSNLETSNLETDNLETNGLEPSETTADTEFESGQESTTSSNSTASRTTLVRGLEELEIPPIEAAQPLRSLSVAPLSLPSLSAPIPTLPQLDPALIAEATSASENSQKDSEQNRLKAGFQIAQQHYKSVLQDIQQQRTSLIQQGENSLSQIDSLYQKRTASIPQALTKTDATLDQQFHKAQEKIESHTQTVDANIIQDYRIATYQLNLTTRSSRAAVNRNADTAETQIETILADLSKDFVSVLTDAKTDCGSTADQAAINITQWERQLDSTFSTAGYSQQQARNEAKKKAAPGLVQTAITQLNLRRNQTITSYDDSVTQINADIKQSVHPTLNARAIEIESDGNKAITRAKTKATWALRQQADQARKTLMQMRTDILNQLVSQHSALRAQLFNEGQQAIAQMQRQARTASQTITNTVEAGLPLYSAAATELHSRLTQTAEINPESLQTAVPKAASQTRNNLETGRTLQDKQITTIHSGVSTGLTQQEQQTLENIQTQSDAAQTGIVASQEAAIENLDKSAAASTKGFSKVSTGVLKAAKVWSLPLATVFKTYLESAKTQIMEGYPAFLLQVNQSANDFTAWVRPQLKPESFFDPSLTTAWATVETDLKKRTRRVGVALTDAGIFDDTDEAGVTGALRGLTKYQGNYVRIEYRELRHKDLEAVIKDELDGLWDDDDRNAAISYLNGRTAEGARFELNASIHWYNDEESRIESVLRSLNTEELKELHRLDRTGNVLEDVQDSLGGTDRAVFDTLTDATNEARFARADVYRMRDRIDEERRRDNDDNLNTVLTEYSQAGQAQNYGGQAISAEERRRLIQQEFAAVQGIDLQATAAANHQTVEQAAAESLFIYATRNIEEVHHTEGGSYTVTKTVEGAQKDLARALIFQGDKSVQTRAARLGVEVERSDQPNLLNLDTALVDPRLNPDYLSDNPDARARERQQALQDREDMFRLFAENYGTSPASGTGTADSSQGYLIEQIRTAYGDETKAADIAEGLVRDDYPTPATAALAMEYAIDGLGTDNALIDRTIGRMNRDEIAQMRSHYDERPDNNLYEDLGVYGQGFMGDLSGSDRLKAERMLLGQPRNAKERAEVAAFAMNQQRRENSGFGSWLAGGSFQADALAYDEQQLSDLTGIEVSFKNGIPEFQSSADAFTPEGAFTGDSAALESTIAAGQLSAQNYESKIDQYATVAATTIAVVGAIAAAVATVATGGVASPLLLAAIAGITGAAGMGAQAAIKGGRYGWEDAATDLGMTAVQALTAGVGQGLGLASRGGVEGLKASARTGLSISAARRLSTSGAFGQMGRLTGSEFADKLVIGMATGGLGSLGQTALTEQTYANNKGAENLLASLFRGMLSGAVTSGISNSIEDRTRLGNHIGSSKSMFDRGLGKSFSSSIGAFGGKGAELGFESARGTYRGDAGDIFVASLEAGGQSALQSFGEGGFEARAQGRYNRWRTAAEAASQTTPRTNDNTLPTDTPPPIIDAPDSQRIRPLVPDIDTDLSTTSRLDPDTTVSRSPIEPQTTAPPAAQPPRFTKTLTEGFPAVIRPADIDEGPQRQIQELTEEDSVVRSANTTKTTDSTEASVSRTDFEEGAAAAVAGSRFQGDALRSYTPDSAVARMQQSQTRQRARRALELLVENNGLLSTRASVGDSPDHVVLTTPDGAVGVRMTVVLDMPPDADGTIPVARFRYDDSTGEYQVSLSARAHPDAIERALAHELTEIRVGHGNEAIADALRPGGLGARPLSAGETPQLSAHDQARLAELDVLGRQLHQANTADDRPRAARIRDEAERLANHLGLVGDSDAVMARRQAATEALADRAIARTLLQQSAENAAANPFLQRRSDDIAADLELLTRQLTHAQEIGDSELVSQVMELARRRILTSPLLVNLRRHNNKIKGSFNILPIERLIAQSHSPEQLKSLVDTVKESISGSGFRLDDSSVPVDPARIDPSQSEVVRQQFGDRPHFQDWPDFRQRFFGARRSYSDTNAEHLAYAFSRWASGDFIGDSGALSSLISAVRRPDPGYEARYIEADGPVSRPDAVPDGQYVLPTGESVDQAVADRVKLIGDRTALQQELDHPQTTAARAEEIDAQLRQIGRDINVRSEQLGEAAGRQIASQQPGDWTEIPIPRAGAGVPDLVFEGSDGRLLMIEAKGGTSELGVRRSADRTRLVQQGTRDYAESLAAEMIRSTNARIRELGQRIELALAANPPNLDYLVVRQPFNNDGTLSAPTSRTFDLGFSNTDGPPRTAAAIKGSKFVGDLLDQPREHEGVWREVKHSVEQITQQSSIGQFIDTQPGSNVVTIQPAIGKSAKARILLADSMRRLPSEEGVPVARINPGGKDVDYTINLSTRVIEGTGIVERALAHEFAEIHRMHNAPSDLLNILKPDSTNQTLNLEAHLSPHDHGRLLELETLTRQIDDAITSQDLTQLRTARDETLRLLDHLGLTGNTESAITRQRLVQETVGDRFNIPRLALEQENYFTERILRKVWTSLTTENVTSSKPSLTENQLRALTSNVLLEDSQYYLTRGAQTQSIESRGGVFDGHTYSDTHFGPTELGRRILRLGEGRLEHLERYLQSHLERPGNEVTITTLLTEDDFSGTGRELFEQRLRRVERLENITIETGFDATTKTNQGEPYHEIYFDFPRLGNHVAENVGLVEGVLLNMHESGFTNSKTDVLITLGLENKFFNPFQLLASLRQRMVPGASLESFEVVDITLVRNKIATGSGAQIGKEGWRIPFSVEMRFRGK